MKKIVALLLVCLIMCEFFSLCAFAEIPADWNSPSSSLTQSPATNTSKDIVSYKAEDAYDISETVSTETPILDCMDSVLDENEIINNLGVLENHSDGISRIGYYPQIKTFAIVLSNSQDTLKVFKDFPEDVYTELINSTTPYAFYWNKIQGKYSFTDYTITSQDDKIQATTASNSTPTTENSSSSDKTEPKTVLTTDSITMDQDEFVQYLESFLPDGYSIRGAYIYHDGKRAVEIVVEKDYILFAESKGYSNLVELAPCFIDALEPEYKTAYYDGYEYLLQLIPQRLQDGNKEYIGALTYRGVCIATYLEIADEYDLMFATRKYGLG
ncbi:MAG: KTSC domain-containing protein [Oscillospiraceae bacterium]|nr:KTSC domain-containing protein [Oscillospiraceae bacterium]